MWKNKIINDDCFKVVKQMPDNYIDLICTSPPYATARKKQYGGIEHDQYVEWFLPLSSELQRILKPTGSFILNIKENCVDGERHPYVMELILAMRKQQGYKLIDEYIWHKKNSMPGRFKNKFRDGWEHLFHFSKTLDIQFFQDAVRKPIGDWTKQRVKNLGINDMARYSMKTQSGFGRNMSYWKDKETVLPDNVLYCATESSNKQHSAAYPEDIPDFFIKLLTKKGDIVFDPFLGSGTTCVVSKRLSRNYIGTELNEEYFKVAQERINNTATKIQTNGSLMNAITNL